MINFLKRFTFLQKILGLDNSGRVAKDRLRLVLIHDHSSISPQLMENLKFDLIKIISKYMVIDEETIEMGLDNRNGTVALAANIPILKIKSLDGDAQQLQLLDEGSPQEKSREDKKAPLPSEASKQKKETEKTDIDTHTSEKEVSAAKSNYSAVDSTASVKTRRRAYNNYRSKKTGRRRKKIAV